MISGRRFVRIVLMTMEDSEVSSGPYFNVAEGIVGICGSYVMGCGRNLLLVGCG